MNSEMDPYYQELLPDTIFYPICQILDSKSFFSLEGLHTFHDLINITPINLQLCDLKDFALGKTG